ncbi:unnamed protein product, partial [Allacma fusca]
MVIQLASVFLTWIPFIPKAATDIPIANSYITACDFEVYDVAWAVDKIEAWKNSMFLRKQFFIINSKLPNNCDHRL